MSTFGGTRCVFNNVFVHISPPITTIAPYFASNGRSPVCCSCCFQHFPQNSTWQLRRYIMALLRLSAINLFFPDTLCTFICFLIHTRHLQDTSLLNFTGVGFLQFLCVRTLLPSESLRRFLHCDMLDLDNK